MKLTISLCLLLTSGFTFAKDTTTSKEVTYEVKVSDVSRFICSTMNVYIMENCIKDVNRCMQDVMSQRILLPGGESQRFVNALKECSVSL